MSGHSRWSQIKHQKGVADQKRGQLFSKLARIIIMAARKGADPRSNSQLQAAIERAQSFNVPRDNIERAIKRAKEKDADNLEEILVQAIGPGSVAIIIKGITDNKNRTLGDIKNILAKHGTKMVAPGSLSWMFDKDWNAHAPVEVVDPALKQKLNNLLEELAGHAEVEDIYLNIL